MQYLNRVRKIEPVFRTIAYLDSKIRTVCANCVRKSHPVRFSLSPYFAPWLRTQIRYCPCGNRAASVRPHGQLNRPHRHPCSRRTDNNLMSVRRPCGVRAASVLCPCGVRATSVRHLCGRTDTKIGRTDVPAAAARTSNVLSLRICLASV